MDFIKQISTIILTLTLSVSSVMPVFAAEDLSTSDSEEQSLTESKSRAIVQNCSSIKQSLAQLQRADSRTRTYLGSAYEAISGRFITPLNLRLVKNNLPSTELFRIQNDFVAHQNDFRDTYVGYMRELESLISIDCAASPQVFYDKLEIVRRERENLRQITQEISQLVDAQYKTVEEIKSKL